MIDYIPVKKEKRSPTQNDSMHAYFQLVADECLERGIDLEAFVKIPFLIPMSKEMIKGAWQGLQQIQLGKKHTSELTTEEVSKIYDTFNRFLSNEFKFSIPFPSDDETN